MTTIGSLFSGIGGLERGLEMTTGARTAWQVEADPFCRRVLARHWPHAERFDDVRTARSLPCVDIMCGGFPCQDVSLAGKGAGIDGERSGLWREFARIIGESRPRVVVIENVAALAGRGLNRVIGDLARRGYVGSWNVVSAAAVGAPHLRRRIFIVAADADRCVVWDRAEWHARWCDALQATRESLARYARKNRSPADTDSDGREGFAQRDGEPLARCEESECRHDADGCLVDGAPPDATGKGLEGRDGPEATRATQRILAAGRESWCGWLAPSPVRRVDDGLPVRVDRPRRRPAADKHRLKALGNAVVPQAAMVAGHVVSELLAGVR